MACDAQTLATDTRCLWLLSPRQLMASWALSVCNGAGPVPPTDEGITTDPDNEIILDEDGNIIVPD